MNKTADDLRETLEHVLPLLKAIDDESASCRPLPNKWSPKEILGHLLDSACNNQQKFVRTMASADSDFVGYEQNLWVNSQKYNSRDWYELITFWQAYNLHLAHVIETTATELLPHNITIADAGIFTLGFIMEDYVEHLKHHLKQILPELLLTSKFQTVYNA